ncbi:extracellular solute-binding protein [Microbacterium rhizomatis]|uniref:Extracellular solute-binding protein n=1 Tax=Microbacterium rhizomatis TaxID=1631477 RepID=A0A5J5J0I7_9MICO|nr:extracellular solute-binding protein [Microbacterium rhizomatis]KAA9108031.1 extracellular solute-binding protein [Microbacterium rhizomatis]
MTRSLRRSLPRRGSASLRGSVLAALVGAGLVLTACASGAPAGDAASEAGGTVVWADYGGSTNESFNAVFFDDFAAATGIEVVSTTIAGAVQYEMFDGGAGDYDAQMTGLAEVELYKDNLLKLPADVPRADMLPESVQDYAFGGMMIGYAQAYVTDTFPGGGPKNWADFWNVEAFPGMRAVPGEYHDYMFEAALLADGVAPEDLYPLDFDRALAKLDELRPYLTFYTEYPQVQQLLSSGSVALAFGPNGLFAGLANEGIDMTVVWDEAFVEANLFVVASAAPNADNAFALAEFLSDPERQAAFSERTNYGPGSSAAFEFLDADVIERLPNAPSHTGIVEADAAGRAAAYDDSIAAYTTWLAG